MTLNLRNGYLFLCLALCAAAPVAAQAPAAPQVEVDRDQLQRRLGAVHTLIEKSTAARQIEASGEVRAIEKREQARKVHREAQQAYDAGDFVRSSRLLPEASVRMFEAVRLAAPEQIAASKARTDFDARAESVRSLLAAQKRISAEKGEAAGGVETTREIERALAEAERLATSDIASARIALDRGYLVAKAAIGSMRSGDTLVRSLNFATPQEEYHYELDRNDTHLMLVQVLLKDKGGLPASQQYVENARGLRSQAEATAGRGDHAAAIRLLEDSTRELVRAIRGAGVFIPG